MQLDHRVNGQVAVPISYSSMTRRRPGNDHLFCAATCFALFRTGIHTALIVGRRSDRLIRVDYRARTRTGELREAPLLSVVSRVGGVRQGGGHRLPCARSL